jgi:hypothetical protein
MARARPLLLLAGALLLVTPPRGAAGQPASPPANTMDASVCHQSGLKLAYDKTFRQVGAGGAERALGGAARGGAPRRQRAVLWGGRARRARRPAAAAPACPVAYAPAARGAPLNLTTRSPRARAPRARAAARAPARRRRRRPARPARPRPARCQRPSAPKSPPTPASRCVWQQRSAGSLPPPPSRSPPRKHALPRLTSPLRSPRPPPPRPARPPTSPSRTGPTAWCAGTASPSPTARTLTREWGCRAGWGVGSKGDTKSAGPRWLERCW